MEDKHFLKKVTIQGFKSFVDRTELVFETGITAVVGPNGCGKSNILDALRWVLGEQNPRLLRASRMEDVIFSGTDSLPAVNLSEISVVFSNASKIIPIDYDEVVITRRLFRSGESEYYLNDSAVRLKDIEHILAGTGIGTSAYSFLEQGKIAQIVESKPESRRIVFEEAAGITRYETKKQEAEKKLRETEDNLLRINDIITEVSRQLNSIQRQVAKAQRYKEEFETLRAMDVKLATHKGLRSISEKNSLKSQMEQTGLNLNIETANLQKTLEEEKRLGQEFLILEQKLAQTKAEQINIRASILSTGEKIDTNKQWFTQIDSSNRKLIETIEFLGIRINSTEIQICQVQDNEQKIKTDIHQEEDRIFSLKENEKEILSGIEDKQVCLNQIKEELFELQTKKSNLKNELLDFSTQSNGFKIRLQRHQTDNVKIAEQEKHTQSVLNKLKTEQEEINAQLAECNLQRQNIISQIQILQNQKNIKTQEVSEYEKKYSACTSRAETLKQLEIHHEGYGAGVKYILDEIDAGNLLGIKGTLAQYIQVKQGFEKAVKAALEDIAKFLICENMNFINPAADLLKQKKLSKTTFVLADSISSASANIEPDTEGIGKIADCITVPEEAKGLFQILLRSVWYVKDIEEAKKHFHILKEDDRLVTLDGEIITRHTFTTGSVEDFDTSVIGRKDRIKELDLESVKISDCILNANREISALSAKQDEMSNHLLDIENKIKDCNQSLACVETNLNIANQDINRIVKEKQIIQADISEIQSQMQDIENRESIIKGHLLDIDIQLKALEESLLETEGSVDEMNDKKQSLELEITRLQMQVSNLKNQLKHFFETKNMLQESVNNDKKSLQNQNTELEENRLRIEQIQKDNAVLEQDLLDIKTTETKFSDIILSVEKQRQDAHQALENNRCASQNIREKIESLKNQNRDTEIKLIEIDHCIDSIRMYIESTYHIDIDLTVEDRDENWDDIKIKIDQSKQRIAQMGEVNMAAIEENKELKERFDFLTLQHDDLVKSKDSLLKTIDRIDKTARQMFIETFEKIKENFKIYFKQLFDGGEADILLLDPSDALTSGIEIVARPPGKKLQTIALLSGGEKALTAVAILFAIFRVKPSPFCVLDEIDAPLDESNIGRFTALLREFAKDSQFVIITHNKKTIEIADIIYGVTMPEYGTSRMVSVKFVSPQPHPASL